MARKKKKDDEVKGEWIVTYSDMVTLLLCFFVALFNPSEIDETQLAAMVSTFANLGMGASTGGNTLSHGTSADLGNTILSLPAMSRGRSMGDALKRAVSLFNTEVHSNMVRLTEDERGLVISLAGDIFFNPASARLNIEESREILMRVATFLAEVEQLDIQSSGDSSAFKNRRFRIEGFTDNVPADPTGPYKNNWDLSVQRSISVLQFLVDLGVHEENFYVAGFSQFSPIAANDTEEGRKYNRRVDIIVLDPGHL
ncbi:flagellar motor protein MotB [Breznakiellaceae bacterium SP9]